MPPLRELKKSTDPEAKQLFPSKALLPTKFIKWKWCNVRDIEYIQQKQKLKMLEGMHHTTTSALMEFVF